MQLFKMNWVNHEDSKPIFSVDVHPQGGRFATGGQGGSGGRIVIWNLDPVLDENEEVDPNVPLKLCQMDNHVACVNVVRWSNSGHLLASGGDDKLVMIWKLTSGVSTVFGSGTINVETWKCIHTLNLHTADVLDLSWSPCDTWLATASADNTVIIWNAQKFPERVAHLKNHTGLVKGVAWDPVGKYIASQADDNSLRLWHTSDWAQQEVFTEPFIDCSATTYVSRLSWSPDGQYLVSPNAMNTGEHTAQIIEREGWKQDIDFVGHAEAVICARFNPNILKKTTADKTTQYCCCAIGSGDKSISVWLTTLKRPLAVIKELFDDSVLDITWGSNGLFLLACSRDGTVACVTFEQKEMGTALTLEEKNDLYERVYRKSLLPNGNIGAEVNEIVQYPAILKTVDESNETQASTPLKEKSTPSTQPITKDVPMESPQLHTNNTSVLVTCNKQMEIRLSSGKRRIEPSSLTPVPSDSVNPLQSTSLNSSKESSKVLVLSTPGLKISQLICCDDMSGDEPNFKSINPLYTVQGVGMTKNILAGTVRLQITNNCHRNASRSISKIEVFRLSNNKEPVWDTYLGSLVQCVEVNKKLVVACCDDSTINIYDLKTGLRMLPPLLVDDLVSSLTLSEQSYCLVLTKTGFVHMWQLNEGKCVISRVSIRCLLSGKGTLSKCGLSPSNQPVITLSDGRCFCYSMDLLTWVQLFNPIDPVSRNNSSLVSPVPVNLPLATMQRNSFTANNLRSPSELHAPGVTLSFLESQITATKVLHSDVEYKYWLLRTVNHLLENGPECRLRQILDDLIEPVCPSSQKLKNDWWDLSKRRAMLKDILNIIKTKMPWQKLYKEYVDHLNIII